MEALKKSYEKIDKEIKRLEILKKVVRENLDTAKKYDNNDSEIEERVAEMFEYIIKNNMEYEGELVLIIDLKTSMMSRSGYVGELQIKIK